MSQRDEQTKPCSSRRYGLCISAVGQTSEKVNFLRPGEGEAQRKTSRDTVNSFMDGTVR